MSGHSKWSTIKRKKEKSDAQKGKLFTKLIREITVAARMGGTSDENVNPRLKSAIQKAKDVNMPLDNIRKAAMKGAGELPGVVYEEITYEGYASGGVAVIVECMTDNKQRTVAEVRHAFSKRNGNLGENGSVSWMFKKQGVILISPEDNEGLEEEVLMDDAIEAGAMDVQNEDNKFVVYTEFEDYIAVHEELEKKYKLENSEVSMIPDNYIKVPKDKVKQVLNLIEMLEDLDDTQQVYTNADFDEEDLEELAE